MAPRLAQSTKDLHKLKVPGHRRPDITGRIIRSVEVLENAVFFEHLAHRHALG